MKTVGLLLYLLFILPGLGQSIEDDDIIIATVGDDSITRGEFVNRLLMTIWPEKHRKGYINVIKRQFLYSMIAERLLAQEAERVSSDPDTYGVKFLEDLEIQYAMDQLYRDEVHRLVGAAEPDIREAVTSEFTDAYVSFIFTEDRYQIDSVWNVLRSGVEFDSIGAHGAIKVTRNFKVDWSATHPDLAGTIGGLNVGAISSPVPLPFGYYIVRLDSKQTDAGRAQNEFRKRITDYEEYLMQHRYSVMTPEFLERLYIEYDLHVDSSVFDLAATALIKSIEEKELPVPSMHREITLDKQIIESAVEKVGERIKEPIISIGGEITTVGELFDALLGSEMHYADTSMASLQAQVRAKLNNFIIDQLIIRKAYDGNLHRRPVVVEEMGSWRRHFLAEYYKTELYKNIEVTPIEIYDYYEHNRDEFSNAVEVNIREILVETRKDAMEILLRLNEGDDFGELARFYSKRTWAAERNGEFGYFPSTLYGEIGLIASTLEPGGRFGPLPVEGGYSIFELIDKREPEGTVDQPFVEVKESIESLIKRKKFRQEIEDVVSDLASREIVYVDYDALYQTDVAPLNILVLRYFGFGEDYLAVPMLDQIYKWRMREDPEREIIP
jgi:parvulin-like peptidyl-prolyl isomerase